MEDTLKAKATFEAYVRSLGVKINHYHADNGRIADKDAKQAIQDAGQTISYYGVNAHFRIGELKRRSEIFKTRGEYRHSTQDDTTHLWPYALAHVCNVDNHLPNDKIGVSPLELFSSTEVKRRLKIFHTFGCQISTLDSRLQNADSVPKLHPRCRIGFHLGNSPRHARSISLVLNLDTARVSPQIHVSYDEFFETVTKIEGHPP